MRIVDPIKFGKLLWPDVQFYRQQKEIIYSIVENKETVVPAGNMLGKDFVTAFIVLWFFLSRNPCRVLLTSVNERHIEVLWGEIDEFIRTSKYPLSSKEGGPLVIGHETIRKIVNGQIERISYIMQKVCNEQTAAGMGGHHVRKPSGEIMTDLPRNLLCIDEASAVMNTGYEKAKPCFMRMIMIGNTWPCNNFFRKAVEGNPETKDPGGDLSSPYYKGLLRKVIHIRGQDSPNVRYGEAVVAKYGLKTAMEENLLKDIIPGLLPYLEYRIRRDTFSKREQCISLDAEWFDGAEDLLFPSDWLEYSSKLAETLSAGRKGTHIGVDPAEGGDSTCWCAIDKLGVIGLKSMKTPNTSIIPAETIAFAKYHGVLAENVYFDLGGGGKEHYDRLHAQGFKCRGVRFGAAPTADLQRGMKSIEQRVKQDDTRYVYLNRRVEMYGLLSLAMNPDTGEGFGIPSKFVELRRQLAPIPRKYDKEGRLFLPPKNAKKANSDEETMRTLIGCSPDEADALVLAMFGLKKGKMMMKGGVLWG